jgi:hypothetical protein
LILGLGGSIGFAAPSKKFAFAYVMNRMGPEVSTEIDPRYNAMLTKIVTMINTNDANLNNSPSLRLFIFISTIFSIKFTFY